MRGILPVFAAAVLVPTLLISFLALRTAEEDDLMRLRESAGLFARDLAHDLDREHANMLAFGKAITNSPLTRTGDLAAFQAYARVAAGEIGGTIALLDSRLEMVLDSVPTGAAYKGDADTAMRVLESGEPAVSGWRNQDGTLQFSVSALVRVVLPDGTRYLLALTRPSRHLEEIVNGGLLPPGWYGRVIDRAGRVLAEARRRNAVAGTDQSIGAPVRATDRLRLSDFLVEIEGTTASVQKPLRDIQMLWGLASAVLLALTLIAAMTLSQFISRPIEHAAEAAGLMGRGGPMPDLHSTIAEANSLAEALAAADVDLRRRTRALKEARDIARRRAREAEESRALLHTLLEHVPAGITIALGPPDFPVVANSQRALEQFGFEVQDATLGQPVGQHTVGFRVLRPDGTPARPEEIPLYRATHHGESIEGEEYLIERADGTRIVCSVNVAPVRDDSGAIIGAVNCWTDITDRKRSDAAAHLLSEIDHDSAHLGDAHEIIRRSVNRLGTLLGVSRCQLSVVDSASGRVIVEPGWLDGVQNIEGTYDLAMALTPELEAALFEEKVIAVDDVTRDPRTSVKSDLYLAGEIGAFATCPVSSAGKLRALLSVHSPAPRHWRSDELALLREVAGRVWAARERALSEAALRASEERYRLAAQAIQGMIFDVDVDTGRVERSQGLAKLLGFKPEEVPPTLGWWRERYHPEDRPRLAEERREAQAERRSNVQCRYRMQHREGRWVHVQENTLIVYHPDGRPKRWVGSINDITAQITAEIRLRETEERFRALVEASAQAVWTADSSGQFVEDSPSWRAFTGQTTEQLLGWGWLDALHPEDRLAAAEAWRAAVAGTAPTTIEYRLWHSSGDWRWTQVRAVPLLNPDGSVRSWVGMNIDVTERRKWEEQQSLLQGELSHRVKNVLAVVQSMATRTLTGNRSLAEASEILTRRLRALSRAHDMLITRDWRGAPLRAIIEEELAPFAERTRIEGPDITIGPRMAQTLALVLHELATNATKHGALSNGDGQVSVTWAVTGAGSPSARFVFEWRETGGPPVAPPVTRGFGSSLLSIAIADDQDMSPRLRFEPGGVIYEINVPLAALG